MARISELNCKLTLRGVLAAGCMVFAGAAFAQSAELPSAFVFESRLVAELEAAPHEQLKEVYADCANESEARLLGSGEAAVCSIVYETLKRRVFGGDFEKLLAWSRAQRASQLGAKGAVATPAAAAK